MYVHYILICRLHDLTLKDRDGAGQTSLHSVIVSDYFQDSLKKERNNLLFSRKGSCQPLSSPYSIHPTSLCWRLTSPTLFKVSFLNGRHRTTNYTSVHFFKTYSTHRGSPIYMSTNHLQFFSPLPVPHHNTSLDFVTGLAV